MATRKTRGPTSPQGMSNMYGTDNQGGNVTALARTGPADLSIFEPTMTAPVPVGAVEHKYVPSVTVPENATITGVLGNELKEETTDETTGVVSTFPTWEITTADGETHRIRGGFELVRLIRRCQKGNRVTVQRGADYPSPKNPRQRCASFRIFEG